MLRLSLLASVICAACSDGGGKPIDGASGDGPCGGSDYFTGAVADWDATDSGFCGVFGATFTVDTTPTNTDSTAPNGRFQLCLADEPTTQIDITPPTASSQCALTAGLYQLPGVAVANHAVIASGALIEWRMIGMNRLMPFFSGLGITYDDTKAIVFVHVAGTAKAVTSSSSSAAAIAFDGTTWAAGDTGADVVFANTDITGNSTTVGFSDGSGIGGGTVPIAANTFTYLTLVAQ